MPRFTIHPNIALARTPHTDLYTDPHLFGLIKEKLFAHPGNSSGTRVSSRRPATRGPLRCWRSSSTSRWYW